MAMESNNLSYRLLSVKGAEYRNQLRDQEQKKADELKEIRHSKKNSFYRQQQKKRLENREKKCEEELKKIEKKLHEQKSVCIDIDSIIRQSMNKIKNRRGFSLKVEYPGISLGLTTQTRTELQKIKRKKEDTEETNHEKDKLEEGEIIISTGDASAITFSLDYVSGFPIITGSSVKGRLRWLCETLLFLEEHREIIDSENTISCQKISDFHAGKSKLSIVEWQQFIEQVFGKKEDDMDSVIEGDNSVQHDIFFDAFVNDVNCLSSDYLTPHNPAGEMRNDYKNVVPVQFLRIKPETKVDFYFIFYDFKPCGKENVLITADEKEKFFKKLLIEFGIGAKTNKGYGRLK
ncbi:type III-B CRISPR module RAMP protein Cmr6 [Aerococcaceae bacterium NML190938]|nr:type III-B CRISPR module RAMP protein Cmr6 [Aerococcaceae bacterium NML191219]MCW6667507.1 type III-B CRISPR module RAMP protein Cmr6 [Aerococcaceae bacterium NML190938]